MQTVWRKMTLPKIKIKKKQLSHCAGVASKRPQRRRARRNGCFRRLCAGAVSRQSSSFCLILPITHTQSLWNLGASKEITRQWQNQRSETNKYVSWTLFLKLQAAGTNFEKLLGWTIFKNPNFNPFQSSPVLPIRGICCFCYVILTFL